LQAAHSVAYTFKKMSNSGVSAQIHMRPWAVVLQFFDRFELMDRWMSYARPGRCLLPNRVKTAQGYSDACEIPLEAAASAAPRSA
jgi:hypothetical protein